MSALALGLSRKDALAADTTRRRLVSPGAFSLAHDVSDKAEVMPLMERLAAAGGRILRPTDTPPHSGFRGYVADPDDHAWEIAWNPAWPIDHEGHVRFAI